MTYELTIEEDVLTLPLAMICFGFGLRKVLGLEIAILLGVQLIQFQGP